MNEEEEGLQKGQMGLSTVQQEPVEDPEEKVGTVIYSKKNDPWKPSNCYRIAFVVQKPVDSAGPSILP